jgi:hypothetical protein
VNNIIGYKVIMDSDYIALETKVNDALLSGWEPVGGITMVPDGKSGMYAQAMFRRGYRTKEKVFADDSFGD